MLCASPGKILVEVDLKSAELCVMAWLSQDPRMISDVSRNLLPEDHKDYLDLHSQTAVAAFKLNCPPNKSGLKSINKLHLRTGAKTVNFGVPYQSGPDAIARKSKEEGTELTVEEAQGLIDGYFTLYPETYPYLEECKFSVSEPGWICNPFMRHRRFAITDDRAKLAEQERQACNFPIQSTVADAISIGIHNLLAYREKYGSRPKKWFHLVLQIHDALMFELSPKALPWLIEEVLPACLVYGVDVWPKTLHGDDIEIAKPYHFGFDAEIMTHWGEELTRDQVRSLGIPDKFCPKAK